MHKESIIKQPRRTLTIVSYTLLGILGVMLSLTKIADDDVFWHLATGRWIMEHHTIPTHDMFGIATNNMSWVPFEWGWDVLTYSLYTLAGNYLLLQALPALVWVIILVLAIVVLRRLGLSSVLITFLILLTGLSIIIRLTPRPHVITMLGLMIISFLYFSFRGDSKNSIRTLLPVPLVFLVWANMHPGVLAGILLLLLLLIGEILTAYQAHYAETKNISRFQPLSTEAIVKLGVVVALSFLATLANPNGVNLILYTYHHTQMQYLQAIREWLPTLSVAAEQPILWPYKIALLIGAAGLVYSFKTKNPILGLLYIGFAAYSLRAVRFVSDYAIVALIGTGIALQYFANRLTPAVRRRVESDATLIVLIAVLAAGTVLTPMDMIYKTAGYNAHYGLGVDEEYFPKSMLHFLETHGITGNAFNQFEIGGFLLWERPGEKDFIDSRNLGDDAAMIYEAIADMQPPFEDLLNRYDINYIALHFPALPESPSRMQSSLIRYCSAHREQWKLVYWDDQSYLYLRAIPQFQSLITAFEYHVLDPYLITFQPAVYDSLRKVSPEAFAAELARKQHDEPKGHFTDLFSRQETAPAVTLK